MNCWVTCDWSVEIWPLRVFSWFATALPWSTTACCAARLLGALASEFHDCQKVPRLADRPLAVGSLSAAWAWLRIVCCWFAALLALFCVRYCTSMNWSRMRVMSVTSAPVPTWTPVPVTPEIEEIVSAGLVVWSTRCRV